MLPVNWVVDLGVWFYRLSVVKINVVPVQDHDWRLQRRQPTCRQQRMQLSLGDRYKIALDHIRDATNGHFTGWM